MSQKELFGNNKTAFDYWLQWYDLFSEAMGKAHELSIKKSILEHSNSVYECNGCGEKYKYKHLKVDTGLFCDSCYYTKIDCIDPVPTGTVLPRRSLCESCIYFNQLSPCEYDPCFSAWCANDYWDLIQHKNKENRDSEIPFVLNCGAYMHKDTDIVNGIPQKESEYNQFKESLNDDFCVIL